MIKSIKIENFKTHLKTEISSSNLTILTGINGVGKSSFLQVLLLLRQSFFKNNLEGLELMNADLCKVGTVQDAISNAAELNQITFIIEDSKYIKPFSFEFQFSESELDKTYIPILSPINESLNKVSLFNRSFQYLSAYRNGPTDIFKSDTYQVEHAHQISMIEGRAEMLAQYIEYFGKLPISISTLKHPDSPDMFFKTQIECWLRELSQNINLHISKSGDTEYKIEYSFNRKDGFPTRRFKSKNVGFGITYDLPLLAAILNSKPNDLIIIENPEAHIHPAGQAKLMELICKAAQAGVQFIIETHSDHIINGTLVSNKNEHIDAKNISIYYFDRDETNHSTKPIFLPVENGGKIIRPPAGFFDQIDKDLEILLDF